MLRPRAGHVRIGRSQSKFKPMPRTARPSLSDMTCQAGQAHRVQRIGRDSIGRLRIATATQTSAATNVERSTLLILVSSPKRGTGNGTGRADRYLQIEINRTNHVVPKRYGFRVTVSHRILGKDLVNHLSL